MTTLSKQPDLNEYEEYRQFSKRLHENNKDRMNWLVFADWLEEMGCVHRAELLRLRCESMQLQCKMKGIEPGQWHEFCYCKSCNRHRDIRALDSHLCRQIGARKDQGELA